VTGSPQQRVATASPAAAAAAEVGAPAMADGRTWRLSVGEGPHPIAVSARVADGWLLVRSETLESASDLVALAACNARNAGCAKLALGTGESEPHAAVELPVGPCGVAAARLREAFDGIERARALVLAPSGEAATIPAGRERGGADGLEVPDMAALLSGSGFEFVVRDEAHAAVDLGVPGEFRQADLRASASGGLVAAITFETDVAPPPECVRAAALLLLRASAWLRMVRGTLTGVGGHARARFEIELPSAPTALETGEALAALSVATRLAGPDLESLMADASLARLYVRHHDRTDTRGGKRE
jgi:hypothetical protein